jgi:hypothetical protein
VTTPPEAQTLDTATPINATSTPQGQLEEIADNAAPGMTNDTNEYHLRNVIVVPDTGGGWNVDVALNGDDNLTSHLIRVGAYQQISDELIALYTTTSTVAKVSVDFYLRATDRYGHTNDTALYGATLDKTTAMKVNWSADKTLLAQQILPGDGKRALTSYRTDYMYPALIVLAAPPRRDLQRKVHERRRLRRRAQPRAQSTPRTPSRILVRDVAKSVYAKIVALLAAIVFLTIVAYIIRFFS